MLALNLNFTVLLECPGLGNFTAGTTAVNLEWGDSMPTVQRLQMKCGIVTKNDLMSKLSKLFHMQKSAHLINHHSNFKKHEETLKKHHAY